MTGACSTVLALGLAGCISGTADDDGSEPQSNDTESSDGNETHEEEQSPSETTVKLVTSDSAHHFEPHVVRIEPGESVTWVLDSGNHTATAYAQANDRPRRIPEAATAWDSEMLAEQGTTFTRTFETEGVYDYYCRPHEENGMIGSIIVGDPTLEDQPGMAPPQSTLADTTRTKLQELNERMQRGPGTGDDHHSEDGEDEEDDHHSEDGGDEEDDHHSEDGGDEEDGHHS